MYTGEVHPDLTILAAGLLGLPAIIPRGEPVTPPKITRNTDLRLVFQWEDPRWQAIQRELHKLEPEVRNEHHDPGPYTPQTVRVAAGDTIRVIKDSTIADYAVTQDGEYEIDAEGEIRASRDMPDYGTASF